jgi:predicted transposase/invertase (TIGR01784 family)
LKEKITNPFIDPTEYLELLDEKMKEMEINQLINDAHKNGREEGREEAKFKIAKNLLNNGMANEKISKYTGLSIEQIEKLNG